MKWSILILLLMSIVMCGFGQLIKPGSKIIINNPLIYQIIHENAHVELLAGGFDWIEGPMWLANQQKLLFSDIPQNCIYEWSENGGIKLYLKPSGYTDTISRNGEIGSNALLLNDEGELVLCQHGDRRIAKMKADIHHPAPDFITLADSYNGKKLNSPNDAVFSKTGNLYFTDPPYGLEFNMDDPAKELDFQGVYKLDNKGNLTLQTKTLSRPNGIALSPNQKKLYVANSDSTRAIWMVFDVVSNGDLQNGRVFFDATDKTATLPGLPDGMKVHRNGWLFAAGPGGILVFTSEGEHLGTIVTGEKTSNCAFNNDYSALYITADDYLLRLKLKTK